MYSVVDLFAGAGGLSLGFMRTKKYAVKAAFENSPYMRETYIKNHPGTEVLGDVCDADYKDIERRYGKIDVVIGGPPCQGFSNANRQRNHAVSQNNQLVKQYLRAVLELQPKAFVMENVSMLQSKVHRFYMEKGDEAIIAAYNIPVKTVHLQLLDSKFMFDGALQIVQNESEIDKYLWPENEYLQLNVIYKASKSTAKMEKALAKHKKQLLRIGERIKLQNAGGFIAAEERKAFCAVEDYYAGKISAGDLKVAAEPSIMIQRMLSKAKEIFSNNIAADKYVLENGIAVKIRSFAVYDYLKGILEAPENGYVIDSGVLCAADYGAPQKRMRFILAGIKRQISDKIVLPKGKYGREEYRTVRDAISDLEDVPPFFDLKDDKYGIKIAPKSDLSELAGSLRDSSVLRNHIVTKTTETAMERFRAIKQGQNFHSLKESLKMNTYTDVSRTQNTIYLRLNYDEPSGTVINVRKSMWIHPVLDRAVSVREAARLQTFPDSFVFCGSKDKQYQQVGNAVPPILAEAIAEMLAKALSGHQSKDANEYGG